ncbi:hypothetical protein BJP36_19355 [Moorena producens JHB]|uniref:Uncharacterized protein n=1 Tax=Moorena producens (strain JHB) TaxID=1454205 RepID=A0A1D9G2K1_MOOP1|nr:hypothetical protein [Moorena producens]AOY81745.1 hypothetical protein BJP36_19355 [Moorena producens JHB]
MLLKLVKNGWNIKFFLMATSLLTLLSSQPAFANQACSTVEFNGSDAKLRYRNIQGDASSRTISQSNSVRGWSYKGRLASYVIFNGSQSVVIVEEFNPNTGQFGRKLATTNISNSDSIRGWDWDEGKEIASFLLVNSSGTFVAVEKFGLSGFGSRIATVKLSNSALSKLGSSWTWNGTLAEYTLNGRTKVEYFDGDSWGSQLPNKSSFVGNNIVGRSCY